MPRVPQAWDYLILTASNRRQAEAYEARLADRRATGRLARVRETLVVDDLEGRRIGSGGSTLLCLLTVLRRESERLGVALEPGSAEALLRPLRILILHAGGDSRRLPAYGPAGKIFLPLPGTNDSALPVTLFDRLAPAFLELPAGAPGAGQVVVAAGDALLHLDSGALDFTHDGITMVGCHATPEEAARHGVFVADAAGAVRLYLQKPSLDEQRSAGAITAGGTAILDAGVVSLDARAAAALLDAFPSELRDGKPEWSAETRTAMLERGVDLFREIACALGSEATSEHYLRSARVSGSAWTEEQLEPLFGALNRIPIALETLPECSFLHFGSTAQLIESGIALATQDRTLAPGHSVLSVNNNGSAPVQGTHAWIEACRLEAPVTLGGSNVLVGLNVTRPLTLPEGATLEVLEGRSRQGDRVWFVRCYGTSDDFKKPAARGGTFCGVPILSWLVAAGLTPADLWDEEIPEEARSLWNARVFPAEPEPAFERWLWIFDPLHANVGQRQAFRLADRYSAEEVALHASQNGFHARRARLNATAVAASLGRLFEVSSSFSAADLAYALEHAVDTRLILEPLLELARAASQQPGSLASLKASRVLHSLGSALEGASVSRDVALSEPLRQFLGEGPLEPEELKRHAFAFLHESVLACPAASHGKLRLALKPEETIWGRGPARIELGGGWTDTPPYTLEHGGDVANVAINLNGQPPIHAYLRMLEEPVIRLTSIDAGQRLEIRTLDELTDYRRPGDSFALSKAAITLAGFDHGADLSQTLREFGGGFELTTLVGIPKGSGLGTSSILGAVLAGVLARLTGRTLTTRELFHEVLRLEQALTTGGGWQDQAGGGSPGAKVTSTSPGMVATPRIRFVPADLIDPARNGGSTLLYYTGMTRLAKNILEQVVGGYLDREGRILAALEEEHLVAEAVYDALSRHDAPAFGAAVDAAWELQKRLCGDVTNPEIEWLLDEVRPYVHGMRISGAGNGGFLFMIAKSPADAARIRERLEARPLNPQARFFDFEVNTRGLEVTTC